MSKETTECRCQECVSACEYKPGWFLPDQAESAIKFIKEKYWGYGKGIHLLAIDHWCDEEATIDVLSPNVKVNIKKPRYPFNPKGKCVFLDSDRHCQIHDIKPWECSDYIHTDTNKEIDARKQKIVDAWRDISKFPVVVQFMNEMERN